MIQIRSTHAELRFVVQLPAAEVPTHLREWCLSAPSIAGSKLWSEARGRTIVVGTARVWPEGLGDCLIGDVTERSDGSEVSFRRASAFEALLASRVGKLFAAATLAGCGFVVISAVIDASRAGFAAAVFALLIAGIAVVAVSFLLVVLHTRFDANESRDVEFALEQLRRFGETHKVSRGAT